jgi:hypothetical protein
MSYIRQMKTPILEQSANAALSGGASAARQQRRALPAGTSMAL